MNNRDVYYWGHEHPNWGDNITPLIYKWITGEECICQPDGEGRLVMVGSLAHVLRPGDHMWGTGMLASNRVVKVPNVTVHAVRGPLTRKVLQKYGYDIPEIYGDPGVLIPEIIPVDDVEIEHDIGIIPHYVDLKRIPDIILKEAIVIDVCSGVENVMREAAKCKVILASSLHGVILGESLGKPTAHIMLSDDLAGGTFKFKDWYLSSGRKKNWTLDLRGKPIDLEDSVQFAKSTPPMQIDIEPLLDSFPSEWR